MRMRVLIAVARDDLPVMRSPVESFDGRLKSETCRMPYAKSSAEADVHVQRKERLLSDSLLSLSALAVLTAAFATAGRRARRGVSVPSSGVRVRHRL